MRRALKQLMVCVLFLSGCTPEPHQPGVIQKWAVYYDDKIPAKKFKHMDLVVFDRTHYPHFERLKGETIVLGYVSAGEINDRMPEKQQLEEDKALLFHQDHWQSSAVDLTSPRWQALVLDAVDDAAEKGFDGVMLDTIESPLYWAKTKAPERYDAMKDAAIQLIGDIRAAHPDMKIMVNRAFEVLPAVASKIDYELAESIMSDTDVSTGHSVLFPPHTYGEVAEQLQHAQSISPGLKIFTLDYWNPDDVNGLARIYEAQRGAGFIPYVTTIDLRNFTPEPDAARVHRK